MARLTHDELTRSLSSYFAQKKEIAFAFLFGSRSRGDTRSWSDLDVAVYFFPKSGELEIEDDVYYEAEDQVWAEVEELSGCETDLLVMNRAPARIVSSALSEGTAVWISDRSLYLRVLLATGRLFEEYGEFTTSFMNIKTRSRSLSKTDRDRLRRTVDFLETELADSAQFENLTYEEYMGDSAKRRNVERWIENCVNASIDAAKVLIASKGQHVPQTYRETVDRLKTLDLFPEHTIDVLAKTTRLRNILAHEYLDIRFSHIDRFVKYAEPEYRTFVAALHEFLRSLS